jgi:hypothetical protein
MAGATDQPVQLRFLCGDHGSVKILVLVSSLSLSLLVFVLGFDKPSYKTLALDDQAVPVLVKTCDSN